MNAHPIVRASEALLHRLHTRLTLRGRLPMWVVYDTTTREYPGLYVARMHVSLPAAKPTRFAMVAVSVAELRRMLPPGLFLWSRHPNDAPEIIEVWQ